MSQGHYSMSERDNWRTPSWLTDGLQEHLTFDLDPCAGDDTEIGETNWHIGRGEDGLERKWFGTVWVNPPFSYKTDWCEKVAEETVNTECIFLLTPDATDTISWWHEYIVPYAKYVWFSEGRLSFVHPDTGEPEGNSTHGTAVSIFGEVLEETLLWLDEEGWVTETWSPSPVAEW